MCTNPESFSLPLHQLVISEHIATAASYHLILLHSRSSPPPPSHNPLSSSSASSSPPAFKCMALPCQAGLCRQHLPPQILQSKGGGRGTGWMVISLCAARGVLREGDKVGVSQQSPPALLCSTNNRLGDERRSESGLSRLNERKWFSPDVGCPATASIE